MDNDKTANKKLDNTKDKDSKNICNGKLTNGKQDREGMELKAEGIGKIQRIEDREGVIKNIIKVQNNVGREKDKDMRRLNNSLDKVRDMGDLSKIKNRKHNRLLIEVKSEGSRKMEITKDRDVPKTNVYTEKVTLRDDLPKTNNSFLNREVIKMKEADKKTERVNVRRDLSKENSKENWENFDKNNFMPDRGDSEQITKEKNKITEEPKKNIEIKKDIFKKDDISIPIKTYLDLKGRKQLRERYTLKLRNQNTSKNSDFKVVTKDNTANETANDEVIVKMKSNESSEDSVQTEPKLDKKPTREVPNGQRKPIIKTVTLKNDNRVYKAVTFVDQKQQKPILINIPNDYKRQKVDVKWKLSNVMIKPSMESIKVKPVNKVRRRGKKQRVLSPEFLIKGSASPPTEVAKWAPSCVNHHTKPYYEAWIDTTLAAISKCSRKDKLCLEKKNLIHAFKEAMRDRPETPELIYENIHDERYTGKIKVRQR